MNITYRIATKNDVDTIKKISDVMLSHTGLGLATIEKIKILVNSPQTFFKLAFDDKKCVGFVLGVVYESPYNDVKRVSDIGVFVLEEYRRSEIGAVLVEHLEHWAMQVGAKEVYLGQTTGDNPEKTLEFYKRLGYKLVGFNSVKEL